MENRHARRGDADLVDPLANAIVPIVTVSVVDRQGRILLLKREKAGQIFEGYWEVVGGRIEFGETSGQAARRELQEEAGISAQPEFVTVLEHVGGKARRAAESYHRIMFVYVAAVDEPKVIKSEHHHYRWVPIESVPGNIIPFNREAIYRSLVHLQRFPPGQLPLFAEYAFERRLVLIKGGGDQSEPSESDEVQFALFSPAAESAHC